MSRKNRHITDLKYDTKRRIEAAKRSIERMAVQWGGTDFFIASQFEQILDQLDEIRSEVHGIDAKNH